MNKQIKTFNIRIFPNIKQIELLQELSNIKIDIWNTFNAIQINEYETNKKIFSDYDLYNQITLLKSNSKVEWNKLNSKACQRSVGELCDAWKSYFKLRKSNSKSNYPKNIQNYNYKTLCFNQSGWSFKNNLIFINKIPFEFKSQFSFNKLKDMKIKELKIKFRNNKWICDLTIQENDLNFNIENKKEILSLDLGLKNLATGIDNLGDSIQLKNKAKKINKFFEKQIKKVNQKISKTIKYSNRNKKLKSIRKKLFFKKNTQIKQTLHIQSNKILNMNYKKIVIGDLNVSKLIANQKNKRNKIAKSFNNSNIAMFLNFLKYKSKNSEIIILNESYSTQLNCLTGELFPVKVELKDRIVQISDNIILDRDINASINILKRYMEQNIAGMIQPLDLFKVIEKNNLFN